MIDAPVQWGVHAAEVEKGVRDSVTDLARRVQAIGLHLPTVYPPGHRVREAWAILQQAMRQVEAAIE